MKLFVGNIPRTATADKVAETFKAFGHCQVWYLVLLIQGKFAFVDFDRDADAKVARKTWNLVSFEGNTLTVEVCDRNTIEGTRNQKKNTATHKDNSFGIDSAREKLNKNLQEIGPQNQGDIDRDSVFVETDSIEMNEMLSHNASQPPKADLEDEDVDMDIDKESGECSEQEIENSQQKEINAALTQTEYVKQKIKEIADLFCNKNKDRDTSQEPIDQEDGEIPNNQPEIDERENQDIVENEEKTEESPNDQATRRSPRIIKPLMRFAATVHSEFKAQKRARKHRKHSKSASAVAKKARTEKKKPSEISPTFKINDTKRRLVFEEEKINSRLRSASKLSKDSNAYSIITEEILPSKHKRQPSIRESPMQKIRGSITPKKYQKTDSSPYRLERKENSPSAVQEKKESLSSILKRGRRIEKKRNSPSTIQKKGTSPSSIQKKGTSPSSIQKKGTSLSSIQKKGTSPSSIQKKGTSLSSIQKKEISPSSIQKKDKTLSSINKKGRSMSKIELKGKSPGKIEKKERTPSKSGKKRIHSDKSLAAQIISREHLDNAHANTERGSYTKYFTRKVKKEKEEVQRKSTRNFNPVARFEASVYSEFHKRAKLSKKQSRVKTPRRAQLKQNKSESNLPKQTKKSSPKSKNIDMSNKKAEATPKNSRRKKIFTPVRHSPRFFTPVRRNSFTEKKQYLEKSVNRVLNTQGKNYVTDNGIIFKPTKNSLWLCISCNREMKFHSIYSHLKSSMHSGKTN